MRYSNVTFVMALPRSRTAWLANTFGRGAVAMHDPLARCSSIGELATSIIDPALALGPETPVIVVDTSAVFFYPQIVSRFPGAKLLFVSRPAREVIASLQRARQSTEGVDQALACYTKALHRARNRPAPSGPVAEVPCSSLSDVRTLYDLWVYFGNTGTPPEGYFEKAIATNFQVPFDEQRRRALPFKVRTLLATRHIGW